MEFGLKTNPVFLRAIRSITFCTLLVLTLGSAMTASAQVILPPNPDPQIPQKTSPGNTIPAPGPFINPQGAQGIPGMAQGQQPPISEMLGEATLAPPKSIIKLAPLWPYYLTAAVLGVLLLAFLVFWIIRKNRKPKPVPVIPADVRALTGLESLLPLVKEAKAREFSYQASEIIRGYIEERFALRARNRTTREFLDLSLKSDNSISEKHQGSLKQFLHYCDLAKFAKQMLPPEQLNEMYASASQFIKETRPSIMAASQLAQTESTKEAPQS